MSRLVHELYAPGPGAEAAYATPDGDVVQVPQDFAFADTVVALEEEIPTAPLSSNPLSHHPSVPNDRSGFKPAPSLGAPEPEWAYETRNFGHTPRQTAFTGPPPPMSLPPNAGIVTQARSVFVRERQEMQQLWGATYDEADAARLAREEDPFVRLAGKIRRMRTLWSFFEWDRADLMRAAWIGVAVFVLAATVGAFALQR